MSSHNPIVLHPAISFVFGVSLCRRKGAFDSNMLREKLLGNRVVRLSDGKILGTVTRIYLEENGQDLVKIAYGRDHFVKQNQIVLLGDDVVLIRAQQTPAEQQGKKRSSKWRKASQSGMLKAANKMISQEATGVNWWVSRGP
ncbi:MAG: hypothetical protein KDE04_07625 [Anaerolineales bacterium]|nr:hypothetical protein [Anaerolineales bacterium]MCB8961266.1 hypothetical protein [Ardenticatenales bacterium]